MKRFLHSLRVPVLAVAMLGMLAIPGFAQTVGTKTTLSGAVTAAQPTIIVASATGFAVGYQVWIDQELMRVVSVNGTTITVQRGFRGTGSQAHATSEFVLVSPETAAETHFLSYDPDHGAACTRGVGQARVLPWVNIRTGVNWNCWGNSQGWHGSHTAPVTYNSTTDGTP